MKKMKDENVTDADYTQEYWDAFLKAQKEHREEVMKVIVDAGNGSDWDVISKQIILIGATQASMKKFLLKKERSMTKWQKREAEYLVKMYHEILVEADKIYKKREKGL